MGKTKVETQTGGTTTPTPTAEETEMNKLLLERMRATQGGTIQAQQTGLGLVNQLLLGQTPTGELFQQMGGISPEAIGAQATELTRQNLPQFQQLGLMDSGVMPREISRNIANQLLFPAEQFNVGMKQNLLNLALAGQAQVQQPIQWGTQTLANQLAGLRTITSTGTMTQTRNPFLESFYGSMGQGLGQGVAAAPFALMRCWVAKEIFGSWEHPKTISTRYYIMNIAPKWFERFYTKYGERIAKFIHNKLILKIILRPLFEVFAFIGKCQMEVNYA